MRDCGTDDRRFGIVVQMAEREDGYKLNANKPGDCGKEDRRVVEYGC